MKTLELQDVAKQVRRDIIEMTTAAKSGHPGGSMSATDVMVALFFDVMDFSVENFSMEAEGEDIFYLSNGHISPALYSVMARRGFFPTEELKSFRELGSRLQGHPTPKYGLEGVRIATGSLGQGISVAVGHAAAKKMNGDSSRVFVMMGDGELQEGQVWEAMQFAAARKIDNIVAIVDFNNQQIDGTCQEVLGQENLRERFESFGWEVIEVDGHDMEALQTTLRLAKEEITGCGKPVMVQARTIMGKGVDFMEDTNEYHGKVLNAEQAQKALAQLA
ncbi:MAG: transketolase [Rikenellaceae bacterium]